MNKVNIDYSRRMYAGCTVFLITFWDKDNNRFSYTTMSSIYVLGKMVVLGSANNNMLKCIKEIKKFGINFLTKKYLDDIMLGGKSSCEEDILSQSSLTPIMIDKHLSIIEESQLTYVCELTDVYCNKEFPNYFSIIGNIKQVLAESSIVKDDKIDVDKYDPIIFVGTDEGRFFKNLADVKKK